MKWQEVVALAIVFLGLGAGAFLVAQRPAFWVGLGARILDRLIPLIWVFISKRMSSEEEAAWRKAERAGNGDEFMRNHLQKKLKPLFGGRDAGPR